MTVLPSVQAPAPPVLSEAHSQRLPPDDHLRIWVLEQSVKASWRTYPVESVSVMLPEPAWRVPAASILPELSMTKRVVPEAEAVKMSWDSV